MRLILVFLFTFSLSSLFSQSQSTTNTIFKSPKSGENVKIIFDVSNYNSNNIGEFKDKLITTSGILMSHFDDSKKKFTLVYNEKIKISTLIEIFSSYNIQYTTQSSQTNTQ